MRDDLALIRELNDPTATVGEARRLAGLDAPRPALARYGSECGPRTGREHQESKPFVRRGWWFKSSNAQLSNRLPR